MAEEPEVVAGLVVAADGAVVGGLEEDFATEAELLRGAGRVQEGGFGALFEEHAGAAEAQAVLVVYAVDEEVVDEEAVLREGLGAEEAAGGHGDFKTAGGDEVSGQRRAETHVGVVGHEDAEVLAAGVGLEAAEHGFDEAGGDAAVLIEEEGERDVEGLRAADADVEGGGDAQIFTVLEEFEAEGLGGDAERLQLLLWGAVVHDDHVLNLRAEGGEVLKNVVVGMKGDHYCTELI